MSKNSKNNFELCYPVLENTKDGFLKKILELDKLSKCIIELRLDYLLHDGLSIDEIIVMINYAKSKLRNSELIATIRTVGEGGRVDLSREKYRSYIKELYVKSKTSYIDVEYKFYKTDKVYYDMLFKNKSKKVIISMHIFDRVFFEDEYTKIFTEMSKSSGNFLKFAIKIFTKEDLFVFMQIARKFSKILKRHKKECIFIAMGVVGVLSRVWPEFTNTKIVFVSAYTDFDKELGQLNSEKYMKYRNLLAKINKN